MPCVDTWLSKKGFEGLDVANKIARSIRQTDSLLVEIMHW